MDLTAVFVPLDHHDAESVRRIVLERGDGPGWLRVRALDVVGLWQIELLDDAGLPSADPAFLEALSGGQRRAVFVHINHDARQAMVHAFADGQAADEGWLGEPEGLDGKLSELFQKTLAELVGADDGSRLGLGQTASSTIARTRGRQLAAPVGLPTALHSFHFHDGSPAGPDPSELDRVALVACDLAATTAAWKTISGTELARRIAALTPPLLGPLAGVRDEVCSALGALDERSPEAAGLRSVVALELVALSECYVFGGGESVCYLDERVLPIFSLAPGDPTFEDDEEAVELEGRGSVLEVMSEVMPYASPEGAMLEQLGDDELQPLAPWAESGAEYIGSLFRFRGERLRELLGSIDARDVAGRVDRFYRAWWKAGHDGPLDQAFETWRAEFDERSGADIQRFLCAWAEWRTVLELAAANRLQPLLVFYGLEK